MLSGTDGLNNSSMENASGDKPSAGKSLEATLANRSASELFNLGIEFILKEENFQGTVIDERTHNDNLREFTVIPDLRTLEYSSDMVNSIPKFVVRLEKFYDFQDKFKKTVNCKTNSSSLSYEKVNLGTKDNLQCINLGVGCSEQEKDAFIKLFK